MVEDLINAKKKAAKIGSLTFPKFKNFGKVGGPIWQFSIFF